LKTRNRCDTANGLETAIVDYLCSALMDTDSRREWVHMLKVWLIFAAGWFACVWVIVAAILIWRAL
jgi:hypothetical protein